MNTSNDQDSQRFVEVLESTIAHLEGPKNMRRNRPYVGQTHTDQGIRGSQLVQGLTLRDLRDCFIRAYIASHPTFKLATLERLEPNAALYREAQKGELAQLNGNDLYSLVGECDPLAFSQNFSCEVERAMGIFPNLPERLSEGRADRLLATGVQSYIAESGRTAVRESEVTHPETGAKLINFWVLRKNTVFQDADAYLHGLLERNNMSFEYPNGVTS